MSYSFEITPPWWLSGQNMTDLIQVFKTMWQSYIFDQMLKIHELRHVETTSQTGVDILYEELPIKPIDDIQTLEEKREFIVHYENFLDYMGTHQGILLIKDIFNLENFTVTPIRDTPTAHLKPYWGLQIALDEAAYEYEEKIKSIRYFLGRLAPARCYYETQFIPYVATPKSFHSMWFN